MNLLSLGIDGAERVKELEIGKGIKFGIFEQSIATRNAVSNYPYLADNTFSAANINYKGTTYKKIFTEQNSRDTDFD